jgi:transmembrane sensor
MDNNRLTELFASYHKGTATASETDELMAMLSHLPDERLGELLQHTWNEQDTSQPFFTAETRNRFLQNLHPADDKQAVVRSVSSVSTLFLRIAAAAVVVLIISVTAAMLLRNKNQEVVQQTPEQKPAVTPKPIVPGRNQAVLTLADGSQIVLDTAANGDLTQQDGVKVIKLDGRLTYDSKQHSEAPHYNTISTPRGGQYQLELADGSKVWLNAASSLRFPTAFTGNERTVELTGEGYFEVAHNASMPFHVRVNDMEVEVLGTHFNINSYTDEPAIKTTLLEGKVRVNKPAIGNRQSAKDAERSVVLKPGEQAVLAAANSPLTIDHSPFTIDHSPDLEQVMAWKNGRFIFQSADLETVMRQIARWYDVEVIYEKRSTETVTGTLSRSGNINLLLQKLEATGKIAFEIKGKQIIVRPT